MNGGRATSVAAVSAALVAGCGATGPAAPPAASTAGSPSSSSSSPSSSAAARPARPGHRRPAAPPVGRPETVRAGGSTLSVTVTRIIDPLRGSGAALVAGTRPIGVQVTIANRAGATYDSTASGDVSVVTSAGAAAPLFITSGVCATPVTDFESLIGAGTAHRGCVGFAVPSHARILAVRFSPHSRARGTVTWR